MKDEHVTTISITSGAIVKAIVFGLLLAAVFQLSDFLLVLATAVVVASAIDPWVKWLEKQSVPRLLSVLAIYVGFFLVIGGILYFFLPPLVDQIADLSQKVPRYLDALSNLGSATGAFSNVVHSFSSSFSRSFSLADVIPGLQQAMTGISGGFLETARFLFASLFNVVLLIVISFYFAVQESGIEDFFRLLAPDPYEAYVVDLWRRSRKKIGLWMQGQVFLGLLIGIFAYLGLAIFGVKYALVFALIAAVFELIPVFGPVLSAILPTVFAFSTSPTLGLLVLGFFIIIQQFENHLIYPLVVRKIVGVPPILVILALVVGARLAGFWGVLLAIPCAAVLMEIVTDIEKRKRVPAN